MKTAMIAALIFAVHDCSPNKSKNVYTEDTEVNEQIVIIEECEESNEEEKEDSKEDSYPLGNQGYGLGMILSPDCLHKNTGELVCPDFVYKPKFEYKYRYWLFVASYEGCVPCEKLWDRKGEILEWTYDNFDLPVKVDKLDGVPQSAVIGYPTMFLVDVETMEIIGKEISDNILEKEF